MKSFPSPFVVHWFVGVLFALGVFHARAEDGFPRDRLPTPEEARQMPTRCDAERVTRYSELLPESDFQNLLERGRAGDRDAMYDLAYAGNFPIGTRRAAQESWLERAANAGHPQAALEFAMKLGVGIIARKEERWKFYEIAVASGIPDALYHYAQSSCIASRQRPCLKELQLLEQAAEKGHTMAQQEVCESAYLGRGFSDKNLELARKWCERAAWSGCNRTMGYFSWLLQEGIGGPADVRRAEFWKIFMTRRSFRAVP